MRKLCWFAISFAVAAALRVYLLPVAVCLALCVPVAAATVLLCRRQWKKNRRLCVAFIGLLVGLLYCSAYTAVLQPAQSAAGETVELSATIVDEPYDTRYGCRAAAEAEVRGRRVRLLLYLGEECRDLQPGDRITVLTELTYPDPKQDADSFLYYQGKGVQLLGTARGEAQIFRTERTPLRFLPTVFSNRLGKLIDRALPDDAAGLIRALLTGDKFEMSYAQRSDMRMAGVSHTIAISGMHVSILLAVVIFLTRGRKLLTLLLGLPLICFFMLSTGCSPSVVRAAVMQSFFLAAPFFRREYDTPTSLCAAMLVLLLANPYALADTSFQLSFSATAGILLFTGPLYRRLGAKRPLCGWLKREENGSKLRVILLRLRRWLTTFVLGSLTTTLGALIFTTPITVLTFGTFSLYAVLSNLLILWAITLCFIGGLATVLVAALWLPAGKVLGTVLALPVRYVFGACAGIARLPFASLPAGGVFFPLWLLSAYVLFAAGWRYGKLLLPAAGILGGLLLTVTLIAADARPEAFSVTALDVGQGQCICMLTQDFAALYDCGGSDGDGAGQTAAEYLLTAGVRRLDALVLSHYDRDHIGGLAQLLYRIEVDCLYLPDTQTDFAEREEVEQLAAQYGIPTVPLTEPTVLEFSGGSLELLPPMLYSTDNSACIGILFSAGDFCMLATGDMDSYAEELLLYSYPIPDVDLLIAGHHGAATSSCEALLAATKPETVFISVGENRYGHPAQETLTRLEAFGAEVYCTLDCGNLICGR